MEELLLKNCPSDLPAADQAHQLHSGPAGGETRTLKAITSKLPIHQHSRAADFIQSTIPRDFPVTKILTGVNLRKN